MSENLKRILDRLSKPAVFLTLVSQVVALLVLCGIKIDDNMVMTMAASLCAILSTLGIMSSTGQSNVQMLICSASGELEPHVPVNGQMLCQTCGAAYKEPPEDIGPTVRS